MLNAHKKSPETFGNETLLSRNDYTRSRLKIKQPRNIISISVREMTRIPAEDQITLMKAFYLVGADVTYDSFNGYPPAMEETHD